jgi:hypothetical protein
VRPRQRQLIRTCSGTEPLLQTSSH